MNRVPPQFQGNNTARAGSPGPEGAPPPSRNTAPQGGRKKHPHGHRPPGGLAALLANARKHQPAKKPKPPGRGAKTTARSVRQQGPMVPPGQLRG
jgi:hypothetical protein